MSRPVLNIKRIYILMRKALDERFSEYGLTTSQFEILGYLYNAGSIEQQKLQHCTAITPATLTGLLEKLEKRRYITRQQSVEDTRAKVVTITAEGYALLTRLIDVMHQFETDMLNNFTGVEKALLGDWLQRIAINLGDQEYGQCD
jgi:DNA-binding MarR family transcriptional regulator